MQNFCYSCFQSPMDCRCVIDDLQKAVTLENCQGILSGVTPYQHECPRPDYECGSYDYGPEIREIVVREIGREAALGCGATMPTFQLPSHKQADKREW
jgi:hypothetical protein